jgi:hypothetical protein
VADRAGPVHRAAQRHNHLPAPRQTCRDGDPQCDADGVADGHCTMRVALCLNVFDFRTPLLHANGPRKGLPLCQPKTVRRVRLAAPDRQCDLYVRCGASEQGAP